MNRIAESPARKSQICGLVDTPRRESPRFACLVEENDVARWIPEPLAGVDEAGCAPLAGPVVAAACILDRDKFPRGIESGR